MATVVLRLRLDRRVRLVLGDHGVVGKRPKGARQVVRIVSPGDVDWIVAPCA